MRHKFLLILLIIFPAYYVNTQGTLQLINIIFRHGERSPTETYPRDPHINYTWPNGLGQLTNRGKNEMFVSGLNLRSEYDAFLGPYYAPEEVVMYTSYADRCHMSGQLLLAGLYPAKDHQIWNTDILWQPIPVHEFLREQDNKIAMKKPCPHYDQELKDVYFSPEIQAVDEKNKELYEYLTSYSGANISGILPFEFLYNTLEIEYLNNLTLPTWTEMIYPKLKDVAALSLAVFTHTTSMKRLHGGPLLEDIIESMFTKMNSHGKRKLILYSGHDVTLVTLMRTLGFDRLLKPDFGAALILELHKLENAYFVKFFYRPTGTATKSELILESCGNPCELFKFQSVLQDVIPINWEEECLL